MAEPSRDYVARVTLAFVIPETAIRAIAFGRMALGLALLVWPGRTGRGSFGDAVDAPRQRLLVRAIGARDVVLGGGALWALGTHRSVRRWLFAALLADVADMCLAAFAFKHRPSPTRLAAFAMTATAAATATRREDEAVDVPA